jgi:hypothetical protein
MRTFMFVLLVARVEEKGVETFDGELTFRLAVHVEWIGMLEQML